MTTVEQRPGSNPSTVCGFGPGPLRYHGAMGASSYRAAARRAWLVLFLALVLTPLAGCKKTSPAGRYQKDGLSFDHLAGWTVINDVQKRARTVTVQGPSHAVLTMSVFAPNLKVSLETFVSAASKARSEGVKKELTFAGVNLGAEAAQAEAPTSIERQVAGETVRGFEEHFTVTVVTVPVPHTSEYLIFNVGDRAVIVMEQAADKERPKVTTGFQKIVDTIAVGR